MRLYVPAFALLVIAGAFGADRHKIDVDAESDDGILLQRIQQEPLAKRKLALLEKYAAQFPRTTSIAWVYEQLLPIYVEAKQLDKVLATSENLLALDPYDVDAADAALHTAESMDDTALVQKYAAISWDVASRAAKSKRPADPDDVPDWSKQVEFSKQLMNYAEYVISKQAIGESDPQKKADLLRLLELRNAQSKYLIAAKSKPVHVDLAAMSPEKAERLLADDPDNVDYLMNVADSNMRRERDLQKVLSYSIRILELMPRKPRPEGTTFEEWERKKSKYIGAANWMVGVVYGKQGRYSLSDRYLRASLSNIRDNTQALAAAYFYIGYDNYAMAGELHDKSKAVEAVRYSKLCVAIDGPFQPLAQKNLEVLRNEYNVE
jgi:tetratricopeptide (TPR) repeat protein